MFDCHDTNLDPSREQAHFPSEGEQGALARRALVVGSFRLTRTQRLAAAYDSRIMLQKVAVSSRMVYVLVSTDHPANRTGSQPFERFEANKDVLCRRGYHPKQFKLRDQHPH